MGGVMAAGGLWLLTVAARKSGEGDPGRGVGLFMLGSILAIPLATLFAWRFSHVNNGYYSCLAAPLWLLAGAVALGRAGLWTAHRLGPGIRAGGSGLWRRVVVPLGLCGASVLVWHATLSQPIPISQDRTRKSGSEHIAAFDREQGRRPLPIVTNATHLPLYIGLERARRNLPLKGSLLEGPRDIMARLHLVGWDCQPRSQGKDGESLSWSWAQLGDAFYLVTETHGPRAMECLTRLPMDCKNLFPQRPWINVLFCRPRQAL